MDFSQEKKNLNIILESNAYVNPRGELNIMKLKMPSAMKSYFVILSFFHLVIVKDLNPSQP